MSMFGFDDRFAMFGATPVENQFIVEYLPAASGESVKVYLYGLLQCYHPQDGISVAEIARQLAMTEDAVMKAFRYWEHRGLVRRIADNPPVWRYLSLSERMASGLPAVDDELFRFSEAMYDIFGSDRELHQREINIAYSWVEEYHLPIEVVLYFVQFRKENNGAKFDFRAAAKRAMAMAEANVRTEEEAKNFLEQDKKELAGCRAIVRTLGKRRNPSDPELELYRKWTRTWGWTQEAILDACQATTAGGEPSFAYLDAILQNMMTRSGGAATAETLQADRAREAGLREVFRAMGLHGVTVNEGTLDLYAQMEALYPQEIILLGAREFPGRQDYAFSDLLELLESWQKNGLATADEIRSYKALHKRYIAFTRKLFGELRMTARRPARFDLECVRTWIETMGFTQEAILHAAESSRDAEKPMTYLNALLTRCSEAGATTVEAIDAQRAAFAASHTRGSASAPSVLTAQGYEQRSYADEPEFPEWMMKMAEEVRRNEGSDPA